MKVLVLSLSILATPAFASPVGAWELSCFPFRHIKQSELIQFHNDGTGSISRTIYGDAMCTEPLYRVFEDIVFETGKTYEDGTTQLNLNVATAKVTPVSATGLELLRSQNYCGLREWDLAKENNVLTKTCALSVAGKDFSDFYHVPNEPAYTVYKVSENETQISIGFPVGKTASTRQMRLPPFAAYNKIVSPLP
jgi:hypothetical protein